ncbi:MAG: YigZ family protein [Calditrichaeota bacterium]|nr:MAG: YigZ family protein [Calditrichota bacterium]
MDDAYFTIKTESEVETKVKASRFIGRTLIVATTDEMLEQLSAIRKLEYNANHNCYTYIIGITEHETEFKYSDDGEPNGTAGKPMYDVVAGSGVTNILTIVTRYFGGTKLGTGGLVKAYSECAKLALEKSGKVEHFITDVYNIKIEFPLYNQLLQLIDRIGAKQIDSDFSDIVKLKLEVRKSKSDRLVQEIVELSSGKAKIEKEEI